MSLRERNVEPDDADEAELAGRLAVVRAENERLRREYTRARRAQYRRTALGLALVGVIAIGGAFLVPGSRTVLLALGAIGLFGGILTYYLTPERFISAEVGEEVYRALAKNGSSMVSELGLEDARVYVSLGEEEQGVKLYVPQDATADLPPGDALESLFVVNGDSRGVSLWPTGDPLFEAFERTLTDELSEDPQLLADQLADGLVEQFELVRSATPDAEPGRLTVGVSGSAYGPIDRFDHPVASFIAVGAARGLEVPVRTAIHPSDGRRADYLVTCTWETVEESGEEIESETA